MYVSSYLALHLRHDPTEFNKISLLKNINFMGICCIIAMKAPISARADGCRVEDTDLWVSKVSEVGISVDFLHYIGPVYC